MKLSTFLSILVVFAAAPMPAGDLPMVTNFKFGGRDYKLELNAKDFENSPKWELGGGVEPSLSIKEALSLAQAEIDKNGKQVKLDQLERVALIAKDYGGYYSFVFSDKKDGADSEYFYVDVLLNGKVVLPSPK